MSHYKKIQVELRDGQKILRALEQMEIVPEVARDVWTNEVTLRTHWTSFGGQSQKTVIAINKENRAAVSGNLMDGFGFAWNGLGYDMIVDGYDENKPMIQEFKQRYSVLEATEAAEMAGYSIETIYETDGSVRLVCSQYSF